MDLDVPADNRVKTKENEKIDKYLDFARELKNKTKQNKKQLWNMRVTVMPIVVGCLERSLKPEEESRPSRLQYF